MNNCALCNTPITEQNQSKEHVIPQSIGGHLKVKDFICDPCNNRVGHTWDNALADQLILFTRSLNIIREKKNSKYVVTDINNKQYIKQPNGDFNLVRPNHDPVQENSDKSLTINIQAPNEEIARGIVKKIGKKYSLSEDSQILILNSMEKKISPMSEIVITDQIEFGGEDSGKSLTKTALALVSTMGIDLNQCDLAKNYLLKNGTPCYGHYYSRDKDFVKNRNKDTPFHCVHIKADSQLRRIFAYIEYYGTFRVVLSLSSNYQGETKESSYCIDPTSKKILNLDIELDISDEEIEKIYDYAIYDFEFYKECVGLLVGKVIFQSKINNLNNRFSEAMKVWDDSETYNENMSKAMQYLEPHFKEFLKST